MSKTTTNPSSRRGFLKKASKIATGPALATGVIPRVYAAEDNTIKVALVGAGGRGTGAAANALSVPNGPIQLVAMADVFENKLTRSYNTLTEKFAGQMDVPEERKFLGFDGYKNAIDCLSPGDVVILATPPAFRWPHFSYAIDKGVNVFMEKPVTVDGPTTKKMFTLGERSVAKNLKVGVGLMCRHCDARRELYERIQDGQIGDLLFLRAYRLQGPGPFSTGPKPEGISELLFQIRQFHSFMWGSGGCYSDYYIHNIDECCWMKGAWPVKAHGSGGRHNRGDAVDQNFDNYTIEYTFADDSTLMFVGRSMDGCYNEFASYAHGSKGSAIISTSSHVPARSRIFKGQNVDREEDMVWAFPPDEPNPYQLEWDHLIDAIREDKPFNEVKRGAEASLVTSMGRMAAHTGQIVTYDEMLNCDHEFAPQVDQLTMDSPAPLSLDSDGRYPLPEPGIKVYEY